MNGEGEHGKGLAGGESERGGRMGKKGDSGRGLQAIAAPNVEQN